MPRLFIRRSAFVLAAVTLSFGAASCRSRSAGPEPGPSASGAPVVGDVASQVARGRGLFARSCAGCHGASGEGRSAPRLIGPGALPTYAGAASKYRRNQFGTAQDLANFTLANMPPGLIPKPSEDEHWAILAHILSANDVALTQPLGPATAASVPLGR